MTEAHLAIVHDMLSLSQLSIQNFILFLLKDGEYVVVQRKALSLLILILILLLTLFGWVHQFHCVCIVAKYGRGRGSGSRNELEVADALQCTNCIVNAAA